MGRCSVPLPGVMKIISLGPRTPVHWQRISSGHSYLWQDGRLQALSRTVLPAGSNDAGRWSIPLVLNGPPGATGSITTVRNPSLAPYTAAASPAGPAPTTTMS